MKKLGARINISIEDNNCSEPSPSDQTPVHFQSVSITPDQPKNLQLPETLKHTPLNQSQSAVDRSLDSIPRRTIALQGTTVDSTTLATACKMVHNVAKSGGHTGPDSDADASLLIAARLVAQVARANSSGTGVSSLEAAANMIAECAKAAKAAKAKAAATAKKSKALQKSPKSRASTVIARSGPPSIDFAELCGKFPSPRSSGDDMVGVASLDGEGGFFCASGSAACAAQHDQENRVPHEPLLAVL